MRHQRRWVGVLAGAVVAASALAVSPGSAVAAPGQDAEAAVTAKLLHIAAASADPILNSAEKEDARVTISRRDGQRWAFGTAVMAAPHKEGAYPSGWLFVAKAKGDGWTVAFEGEAEFTSLAAESPVVTAAEKQVFTAPAPSYANGDYRTGMRLPWGTGQSWSYTGGPHGWGGGETPFSSIDLAGGDQVVRATRAGTAYTMCKGWIRVIHDRGYATDYYHLWNNISVNGSSVAAGARLGDTGTDVTCGGSATGRHVHFGLRQNSAYVPIANHSIGGWMFVSSGSAYSGSALHGSTRVYSGGGSLYNYGALGFTQGIVDTNGGTTLNKRTGPGTGYALAGSVADGATVSISCSQNGTTHTGRYGSTALWNRLTDGTWVSDAFLWTGLNGPVNGYC